MTKISKYEAQLLASIEQVTADKDKIVLDFQALDCNFKEQTERVAFLTDANKAQKTSLMAYQAKRNEHSLSEAGYKETIATLRDNIIELHHKHKLELLKANQLPDLDIEPDSDAREEAIRTDELRKLIHILFTNR